MGRAVGRDSEASLCPAQAATATLAGPRATPARRTRGWDAACANPTSRAPTASSVPRGSTARTAPVSAAHPSPPRPRTDPGPSVAPPAACQCSSPGVVDGDCDRDSGQCTCRAGFQGATCDHCAPGYFHFPLCQREHGLPVGVGGLGLVCPTQHPVPLRPAVCGCSTAGTLPEGCDEAGRCLCRPEFDGPHCDRCRPGHHGYPDCRGERRAGPGRRPRWVEEGHAGAHGLPLSLAACDCDPQGALDQLCSVGGACRCRPGYTGTTCRECSPGFHGFPACARECPCRRREGGTTHSMPKPTLRPPQPATAPPTAPWTQPATPAVGSAAAGPE